MLTRRTFASLVAATIGRGAVHAAPADGNLEALIATLEKRLGARLGAAILDTGTGRQWRHRADERFPMCSTVKMLACAALLARVDAGEEDLARRIRFAAGDLVRHSPVTEKHVGGEGMTLRGICEATMIRSDNTGMNLVLRRLGGPAGVTAFARSLGDETTRLDRWETALNEGKPGDPRDTTTPQAMSANLRALVLGDRLSPTSRGQLTAWLLANTTGEEKLRAGVPDGWRVGDRTGAGGHGTMNIVAAIWPPGRAPAVASLYITQTEASAGDRNAAMAAVGRGLGPALSG